MQRRVLISVFWGCVFSISLVTAQTPYFKLLPFNRENPRLKVNTLHIDNNGFLLIGTSEGLYKSDGMDESIYVLPKGNGPDDVTAITTDQSNVVYVGYRNGVVASLKNGTLQLLGSQPISKQEITSVYSGKNGAVIITTAGDGFYIYDKTGLHHQNETNGLNDNYVYECIEDSSGNFWLGTDRGVALYDVANLSIPKKKYADKNGLKDNIVRNLYCDETGRVWLGLQDSGICYFNKQKEAFESLPVLANWQFGQVNSIQFSDNDLWIATEEQGLINYNLVEGGSVKRYTHRADLAFDRVEDIEFDHNGNLWMATNSGLIRSHGNWLTFLTRQNGKPFNYIHSIFCDNQNNIWFTPDLQLYKFTPYSTDTNRLKFYNVTDTSNHYNITCMQQDRYGYIWICTLGEGIFRFNPATGFTQKIIGSDKIEHISVLNLKISKGDTIWIATYGGVLRCSLPEPSLSKTIKLNFEDLSQQGELGNFYINEIFIDSKNRVWFGADSKGLICYDKNKFVSLNITKGFKSKSVLSVTEDIYGNIWCSTLSDGVFKFDGNTFTNFSMDEGVREIKVPSIIADKQGRVIMIHNRGLDVYNVKENIFEYYGQDNHLSDLNPDQNSVAADSYGNLWIGSEKGIIKFKPGFKHKHLGAHIFLSRILQDTLELDINKPAKLKYFENNINFEFAGAWLTDVYRVKYQYKLEGYNNDWITTKDKSIFFASLNAGTYKFRVRASLNNNFTAADEASFSFVILKPFWEQLWFIIFSFMIGLSFFYLYVISREKRLRKVQQLEQETINFQLQTLKSQVNPHFLFNSFNTLISVIETNQAVAVEYVQKLAEFFRNMVNYRNVDFISLKEEIQMADAYFFLQQKRFGQNLQLQFNITDEHSRMYGIAPLSVQMLVENAIKHNAVSKETPLLITVEVENIMLVIKNNVNPKLNKEPSAGMGLQNINSRCKLLTGRNIIIESSPEIFCVRIPLIHFS